MEKHPGAADQINNETINMAVIILTDNSILVYRLARLRGLIPFEQNIQAHFVCAPEILRAHFLGKAVRNGTPRFQPEESDSGSSIFRLDNQSCASFASGWLSPLDSDVSWCLVTIILIVITIK